jgi:hypothetical protein
MNERRNRAELFPSDVKSVLERLRHAKATTFGAEAHGFLLNPTVAENDVLAFERHHQVVLPVDYRYFLTSIGNGGAGPYYGVFPLGEVDKGHGLRSWQEQDGIVGKLSRPFPFDDQWNDLAGLPPEELLNSDEDDYWRRNEEFEERYWSSSLVNGAVPICHEGCAIRIWLVVTGSQKGRLWRDGRSEYTGLKPLQLADESAATFSSWYNEWLKQSMQRLKEQKESN